MKTVGFISTAISSAISLTGAGLFVLSTLAGEYSLVERLGGAGWVLLLLWIILMPVITPLVKRKLDGSS